VKGGARLLVALAFTELPTLVAIGLGHPEAMLPLLFPIVLTGLLGLFHDLFRIAPQLGAEKVVPAVEEAR
jgi:hypothetical protein